MHAYLVYTEGLTDEQKGKMFYFLDNTMVANRSVLASTVKSKNPVYLVTYDTPERLEDISLPVPFKFKNVTGENLLKYK